MAAVALADYMAPPKAPYCRVVTQECVPSFPQWEGERAGEGEREGQEGEGQEGYKGEQLSVVSALDHGTDSGWYSRGCVSTSPTTATMTTAAVASLAASVEKVKVKGRHCSSGKNMRNSLPRERLPPPSSCADPERGTEVPVVLSLHSAQSLSCPCGYLVGVNRLKRPDAEETMV